MKKTADLRLPLSWLTMYLRGENKRRSDDAGETEHLLNETYGVITAMMQFHSQLEAVERATPLERIGRGKTSPMTTQAPGPQVVAKLKKKKKTVETKEISINKCLEGWRITHKAM